MPRSSVTRVLVRIAIVLAALAGFLYLFLRAAADVNAEPFVIKRQYLHPWTLALEEGRTATSPILVARPPLDFGDRLFSQVFTRTMESLSGSARAGVPLVLRGEFDAALAARYTPHALLELARAAGLGASAFTPVCVAMRRVSEPGETRQLYFAIFDSPAFTAFRDRLGRELEGMPAARFSPASLSPVLILGATEPDFDRWLPLAATAEKDCMAAITTNN